MFSLFGRLTTLCPGYTETGFADAANIRNTSMTSNKSTTATAEDVAEYGYRLMIKGKRTGIHGKLNRFMAFGQRFISRNLVLKIAGGLLKKK